MESSKTCRAPASPSHTADQGPGWWIRRYLDRLRKLDAELDAENAKRQYRPEDLTARGT